MWISGGFELVPDSLDFEYSGKGVKKIAAVHDFEEIESEPLRTDQQLNYTALPECLHKYVTNCFSWALSESKSAFYSLSKFIYGL